MLKKIFVISTLAITSLLLAACGKSDSPASATGSTRSDSDAIQGEWKVDHREKNGTSEKPPSPMGLSFKGNKVSFMRDGKAEENATFKLDPSKTPHTIQVMVEAPVSLPAGAPSIPPMNGVYELSGNSLKIGMSELEDKSPASLSDKDLEVMVLTR